jgi:hypothetical protein
MSRDSRSDSAVLREGTREPGIHPVVRERLAYLDWLRFFVVLSLAPFHAALSYTGFGVVYVYDDPVRDAILAGRGLYGESGPAGLRLFTVFMDNWFMHLLFVIAGIGAAMSLHTRSVGGFIAERARRLMLPLLVGTLVIIPVQSWFRALDFRSFDAGFVAFYPHFFDGINTGPGSRGNFDYGHLWFLVYLFVFSAVSVPALQRLRRFGGASSPEPGMEQPVHLRRVLVPALWIAVLEATFRPGWPGFQNLVNDWANVTVYLSCFVLGCAAGNRPAFLEAAEHARYVALLLGVVAFALRLACYEWLPVGSGYQGLNMFAQFLRGLAAWGLVVAAIGFGRRHLTRTGWPLGIACDLSFPMYVLHFAPLTAATYALLGSGLGAWSRWALSVAVSWITVTVCTLLFRYVPPLRSLFGIRAPRELAATGA